jgi:hypothetical protein
MTARCVPGNSTVAGTFSLPISACTSATCRKPVCMVAALLFNLGCLNICRMQRSQLCERWRNVWQAPCRGSNHALFGRAGEQQAYHLLHIIIFVADLTLHVVVQSPCVHCVCSVCGESHVSPTAIAHGYPPRTHDRTPSARDNHQNVA